MKITLNKQKVIEAATAALQRGELQCQQRDFRAGLTVCEYSAPCAIGAALTEDERQFLDREHASMPIYDLISAGVIVPDCAADHDFYCDLQSVHDVGSVTRLAYLLGCDLPATT